MNNETTEIQRHLIRYADDFVIVITNDYQLERIQQNIERFLGERGLSINKHKSRVFAFADNSFHFLGYTFSHFHNVKISSFVSRRDMATTDRMIVRPRRDKVIAFKRELAKLIKSSVNLSAVELINLLNPRLRG